MTVTPGAPTGNFTAAEKNKLAGIEDGAQVNKNKTLFISNVDVVVTNTLTETTLTGAGVGSLTISAADLVEGAKFKINAQGIISDTGNPNARIRAKLGSVLIGDTLDNSLGSISDDHWILDMELVVRAEGAPGAVMASGGFLTSNNDHFAMVNVGTVGIDTTVDQTVNITFEWGTAAMGNIVTAQILELECVKV
ncbi:MAG: hypothetical protein V3R83_12420 [Gammaproteobacteria bacterium]